VDTACSSGLVAFHSAFASTKSNDCRGAVTGAGTLKLQPHVHIMLAPVGALSAHGRCFTFDRRGDGYVRAEGAGCMTLIAGRGMLDDEEEEAAAAAAARSAARDATTLIRSAPVRQDGRSASLTAPSGAAQKELLKAAQISPSEPGGLQAHGTATALGDPTEVGAIVAAMREDEGGGGGGGGGKQGAWAIMSHKAAFGHGECSSGQLGLLSTILSLAHVAMAGNAHLRIANRMVHLHLKKALSPPVLGTQAAQIRGFGSVSAFGHSGTIVHIALHREAATATAAARSRSASSHVSIFRRTSFFWKKAKKPLQAVVSPTATRAAAAVALDAPPVPFLGALALRSPSELLFEMRFLDFEVAYLQGHRVGNVSMLPGTAYIEMARALVMKVCMRARTLSIS
jgi:acyl transferase domain-containing protein